MTGTPRAWAIGLGSLAVLWFLPQLVHGADLPNFYLVFTYFLLFWVTQATSWAITSGFAGYFSFGQGAFIGVGVYTTAILTTRQEWNFFLAVAAAGVMSGLLALGTGAVAFRLKALRGEVFALLTLFIAFVVAAAARAFTWIDGGQGVNVTIPDFPEGLGRFSDVVYRLSLVLAVLTLLAAWTVYSSRLGWALFTIRDAEDVAEGLGVHTFRAKMIAFTLTGVISGISGGLHSLQLGYISVNEVFGLSVPLMVLLVAIFGGRGIWYGPAVGAAFIFTLRDRMTGSSLENYDQLVLGLVLIVVVLLVPEGLGPRLRHGWKAATVGAIGSFAVAAALGIGAGFLDWLAIAMVVGVASVFAAQLARRRDVGPATPSGTRRKEVAKS